MYPSEFKSIHVRVLSSLRFPDDDEIVIE